MRDETPIATARRLARRMDRLRCLQCGRRRGVEQHHVAGRNHDVDLTIPLCEACHAQATEMLRRAGVDMKHTTNPVERVARSLNATAVFLTMLAEALWRWAESLSCITASPEQAALSLRNAMAGEDDCDWTAVTDFMLPSSE